MYGLYTGIVTGLTVGLKLTLLNVYYYVALIILYLQYKCGSLKDRGPGIIFSGHYFNSILFRKGVLHLCTGVQDVPA